MNCWQTWDWCACVPKGRAVNETKWFPLLSHCWQFGSGYLGNTNLVFSLRARRDGCCYNVATTELASKSNSLECCFLFSYINTVNKRDYDDAGWAFHLTQTRWPALPENYIICLVFCTEINSMATNSIRKRNFFSLLIKTVLFVFVCLCNHAATESNCLIWLKKFCYQTGSLAQKHLLLDEGTRVAPCTSSEQDSLLKAVMRAYKEHIITQNIFTQVYVVLIKSKHTFWFSHTSLFVFGTKCYEMQLLLCASLFSLVSDEMCTLLVRHEWPLWMPFSLGPSSQPPFQTCPLLISNLLLLTAAPCANTS